MPSLKQIAARPHATGAEYSYRRKLGVSDLLPAIGIGIGAGLFAFYVTRLLLQRTPLRVDRPTKVARAQRIARRGAESLHRA
jgi:hypothetical protein